VRDILKGSAVIFIFKVLGAVSLFLIHILISRYYGAETLGIFSLILSLLTIGAILSRVGLDVYVVRVLPSLENNLKEISLFLKRVFQIVLIVSFGVSILYLLMSDIIDKNIFKSFDARGYIYLLALILPFYTSFTVLVEVLRGLQEIKIYSFFRNFLQNILIVLFLILTIETSTFYNPIYILYMVIFLMSFILLFFMFKYLKKFNINFFESGKYSKPILKYSYPMFLTSSMMFIMGYIDTFMISYYIDEYQVGIYSACVRVSIAITFILASINGFIAPKISKAYAKGNREEIKRVYFDSIKLIAIATTPIFTILYLFPEFFLGLFGEEFKSATLTLIVVNGAFFINALSGPVGIILNMTDNQNYVMRVIILVSLLNIVLNLFFINILGITGAAISTLISFLLWNFLFIYKLKTLRII